MRGIFFNPIHVRDVSEEIPFFFCSLFLDGEETTLEEGLRVISSFRLVL